jgi:hypothetical protein
MGINRARQVGCVNLQDSGDLFDGVASWRFRSSVEDRLNCCGVQPGTNGRAARGESQLGKALSNAADKHRIHGRIKSFAMTNVSPQSGFPVDD